MNHLEELGRIQQLDDLGLHQAAFEAATSLRRHPDCDSRLWYALRLIGHDQKAKVREGLGILPKMRIGLIGEK